MSGRKPEDENKNDVTSTDPDQSRNESHDEEEVKYTPEEEAAALEESQAHKAEANDLFSRGDLHNALSAYEDALLPLPRSARFQRAVLHSNIAACHLRLEEAKEAAKAASSALDELSALEASLGTPTESKDKDKDDAEDVEEEIVSSGAEKAAPGPGDIRADIARIRTKSLLRRARAHATTSPATWSSLSSAQTDYKALAVLPPGSLTQSDARNVRTMLRDLEPRVKEAQEREMGEMWGKLRELGDGILRPFGLSTNNFQMVKDEKTGGYSMNFQQDGDK